MRGGKEKKKGKKEEREEKRGKGGKGRKKTKQKTKQKNFFVNCKKAQTFAENNSFFSQ